MLDQTTPRGGVYLNKENWTQHNWQAESNGAKYPRLLAVKSRYGPKVLFSANHAVGSEVWTPGSRGRLC